MGDKSPTNAPNRETRNGQLSAGLRSIEKKAAAELSSTTPTVIRPEDSSDEGSDVSPARSFPSEDLESVDKRLVREVEEEHRFGGSHWLPLTFALLPSIGSLFFGEPDRWTDVLVFLLVTFFLYKISKGPWDLYASARTARILTYAREDSISRKRAQTPPKVVYPTQEDQACQRYTTELKRAEWTLLIFAICSPAIGVTLLHFIQARLMTTKLQFLNSNSSLLFLLSSLVRPITHVSRLLQQRSRFLQNQLRFPTRLAEELTDQVERLSNQVVRLDHSTVDPDQLASLKKTHFDLPLAELSKKVIKLQRQDKLGQTRSTSKLEELEQSLKRLNEQLDSAGKKLDDLITHDRSLKNSPVHTIVNMLLQVLRTAERQDKRNKPAALLTEGEEFKRIGPTGTIEEVEEDSSRSSPLVSKDPAHSRGKEGLVSGFASVPKGAKALTPVAEPVRVKNGIGGSQNLNKATTVSPLRRTLIPRDDRAIFYEDHPGRGKHESLIRVLFRPMATSVDAWVFLGRGILWLWTLPVRMLWSWLCDLWVKVRILQEHFAEIAAERYQQLSERNYRTDQAKMRKLNSTKYPHYSASRERTDEDIYFDNNPQWSYRHHHLEREFGGYDERADN